MAIYKLTSSLTINGKAKYEILDAETIEECIELARIKWEKYWALSNDPSFKKTLITKAVNKFNFERKNIKFDSAGFLTIK